jgi:ribokinase
VAKVLVLGNAGLDISLQMPRLPRPGETLLGNGVHRAPGGKGLNQAVCSARAGASTVFMAPIGHDGTAEEVIASLATEGGLDFSPLRMPEATDFSLLMVMPDGENSIVSAGPCAAALRQDAAAAFAAQARPGDILLAQGNLSLDTTLSALKAARNAGAQTVLNPAPVWWGVDPLLAHCDILIVNLGEAEAISGRADPVAAVGNLAALGVKTIIVTLGSQGCLVHDQSAVSRHAAVPVEVRDTTGCGDTFCGTLCAALTLGRSLQDAVTFAQAAAAITATRTGAYASLPTRAELHALLQKAEV